jgi:hypothetical protein
MFSIFRNKDTEINDVYRLINKALVEEGVAKKKAEHLYQSGDLKELLKIGRDSITTAELALLWRQSVFAERALEHSPFEEIVQEYVELADQKGIPPEEIIEQECQANIEAAKGYANRVSKLLDSATIKNDEPVRNFCAEHATSMLASWQRYRLEMISTLKQMQE